MAKSRRAFLLESARNTLIGSGAFLVGAVTPSAISAPKLSDITDRMGTVRVGTLIAGDEAGAHTIIGLRADGIQMYSDPNRLVFYVSPKNGGRLRLGAVDVPGITMVGGRPLQDGGMIIDGTLRVSALIVGDTARVFLEEDTIRVGQLDEQDRLSGFEITSVQAGGRQHGEPTWIIDNETGWINASPQTFPHGGVAIGSGALHVNALWPDVYGRIRFETYGTMGDTIMLLGRLYLSPASGQLHLYGDSALGTEPEYVISDGPGLYSQISARLSATRLQVGSLSLENKNGELWIYGDGKPVFLGRKVGDSIQGVVADGANVWITGGGFVLPSGYNSDHLYDGTMYYESATQTIKVRVGSTWKTVQFTS